MSMRETDYTGSITPKGWTLKNWVIVLNPDMADEDMNEAIRGIDDVKNGSNSFYELNCKVQIWGRIFNRKPFRDCKGILVKDGYGVLTSAVTHIECMNGIIYASTASESCYRLEDPINGIGLRDGDDDDITVEGVGEDGKRFSYQLQP